MSGYAASARLRGGSMRFVPVESGRLPIAADEDAAGRGSLEGGPVDLTGRPLAEHLAERWEDLRVTWSQTTFYLFSADGWR